MMPAQSHYSPLQRGLVPGLWRGETAFILGGGPSLKGFDFERVRGQGRVIAVNNAFIKAPWADMLYFADVRWWRWNKDRLHQFPGPIYSRLAGKRNHNFGRVVHLERAKTPLSDDPTAIGGHCSGSNALNIAYLMGATTIILLGFDGRPGNWHDEHQSTVDPARYDTHFRPALENMAPVLERRGVRVINANPESAIRCFEFATIDQLLPDNTVIERGAYARGLDEAAY